MDDPSFMGMETEDGTEAPYKRFKPLDRTSANKLTDKSLDLKTKKQTKWAATIFKGNVINAIFCYGPLRRSGGILLCTCRSDQ